jgi:hypothetical protein
MRLAAILTIFCLPIIAGVAKHTVFGGTGPIWPFFLAACAVAAIYDWKAALLIAAGIGGAQVLERMFDHPMLMQFGLYGALAFVAIWFRLGAIAYTTCAVVSALYFAAQVEILAWFPAVVVSEFALTFGLMGAAWYGGGGLSARVMGSPAARNRLGFTALYRSGHGADRGGGSEGVAMAQDARKAGG